MLRLQTMLFALATTACAQLAPHTTPVPILKQLNKQNDDGSYSFGYEAADGSFKIETKYPNGDVAGKYGYVDESGNLREITYGAGSKRGFEPQGDGIVVPPPALNEPTNELRPGDEDDGQYREDPRIYEDPKYNRHSAVVGPASSPARLPALKQYHKAVQPQQEQQSQQYESVPSPAPPRAFPRVGARPQSQIFHQQPTFSYKAYTPQPYQLEQPQYRPRPQYQTQPQYQPQPQYQSQLQYQPQPQYQPEPQYQPQYQAQSQYQPYSQPQYDPYLGHPAQNFDPNTGSYSINYTG